MNQIRGTMARRDGAAFEAPGGFVFRLPEESAAAVPAEGAVVLGLRPEAIRSGQGLPGFTGTVEEVEPLGYESLVTVRAGETLITLRMDAGTTPALGESLRLTAEPQGLHWFDATAGNRL